MAKKNIIVRLQNWMDSVAGQTFLNYAYSWGASIVILGTLFKLVRPADGCHHGGGDWTEPRFHREHPAPQLRGDVRGDD